MDFLMQLFVIGFLSLIAWLHELYGTTQRGEPIQYFTLYAVGGYVGGILVVAATAIWFWRWREKKIASANARLFRAENLASSSRHPDERIRSEAQRSLIDIALGLGYGAPADPNDPTRVAALNELIVLLKTSRGSLLSSLRALPMPLRVREAAKRLYFETDFLRREPTISGLEELCLLLTEPPIGDPLTHDALPSPLPADYFARTLGEDNCRQALNRYLALPLSSESLAHWKNFLTRTRDLGFIGEVIKGLFRTRQPNGVALALHYVGLNSTGVRGAIDETVAGIERLPAPERKRVQLDAVATFASYVFGEGYPDDNYIYALNKLDYKPSSTTERVLWMLLNNHGEQVLAMGEAAVPCLLDWLTNHRHRLCSEAMAKTAIPVMFQIGGESVYRALAHCLSPSSQCRPEIRWAIRDCAQYWPKMREFLLPVALEVVEAAKGDLEERGKSDPFGPKVWRELLHYVYAHGPIEDRLRIVELAYMKEWRWEAGPPRPNKEEGPDWNSKRAQTAMKALDIIEAITAGEVEPGTPMPPSLIGKARKLLGQIRARELDERFRWPEDTFYFSKSPLMQRLFGRRWQSIVHATGYSVNEERNFHGDGESNFTFSAANRVAATRSLAANPGPIELAVLSRAVQSPNIDCPWGTEGNWIRLNLTECRAIAEAALKAHPVTAEEINAALENPHACS